MMARPMLLNWFNERGAVVHGPGVNHRSVQTCRRDHH